MHLGKVKSTSHRAIKFADIVTDQGIEENVRIEDYIRDLYADGG